MDTLTLRAEPRSEAGSRPARRMRRAGRIPAVVYGRDVDTTPISVDARDLYSVLHTEAGLNAIINVEVDGSEILTVAREVQRDPVRGDIIHLDFINVSLTEEIEAEVGLELIGVPEGVEQEGGILETVRNSIMIAALPTAIPSSVELDVSALTIGDSLKVSDLPAMEGVTFLDDEDQTLVTVLAPRVEEEPEVEEDLEGLELAEGEEPPEGEADEDAGDEDEG